MKPGAGVPAILLAGIALAAKAQAPVDSTLLTRPLAPVMDSLALASPEAQAQNHNPGSVIAAIALLIGAGLLVFLLYNVRSR